MSVLLGPPGASGARVPPSIYKLYFSATEFTKTMANVYGTRYTKVPFYTTVSLEVTRQEVYRRGLKCINVVKWEDGKTGRLLLWSALKYSFIHKILFNICACENIGPLILY